MSHFQNFTCFIFGCAGSSAVCGLSPAAESRGYALVAACAPSHPSGSSRSEHRLQSAGLEAGSSPDQGSNPVLCIARQTLNHWTTGEVPSWSH